MTDTAEQPEQRERKPRNRKYPWRRHAAQLKKRPGEWILLEPELPSGMAHYLRSGQQPWMAELHPHVEYRMRFGREVAPGRLHYQLWAYYSPDREVGSLRQAPSDAVIREMRERFARTDETMSDLAREYGHPVTSVMSWIRGRTRVEAGGPVTDDTNKTGRGPTHRKT